MGPETATTSQVWGEGGRRNPRARCIMGARGQPSTPESGLRSCSSRVGGSHGSSGQAVLGTSRAAAAGPWSGVCEPATP